MEDTQTPAHLLTRSLIITNISSYCASLSIIKDKVYYPQLPGAGAGTWQTAAEDQMTVQVAGLVKTENEIWPQTTNNMSVICYLTLKKNCQIDCLGTTWNNLCKEMRLWSISQPLMQSASQNRIEYNAWL